MTTIWYAPGDVSTGRQDRQISNCTTTPLRRGFLFRPLRRHTLEGFDSAAVIGAAPVACGSAHSTISSLSPYFPSCVANRAAPLSRAGACIRGYCAVDVACVVLVNVKNSIKMHRASFRDY